MADAHGEATLQLDGGPGRPGGRPPGARNKRSADLQRWMAATFGASLGEQMLRAVMLDQEDLEDAGGRHLIALAKRAKKLARELGCSPVEAFRELRLLAADAMPYVHQRQPLAVQLDAKAAIGLVIAAPVSGPGSASGPALDLRPADVRQIVADQGLGAGAVREVAGAEVAG